MRSARALHPALAVRVPDNPTRDPTPDSAALSVPGWPVSDGAVAIFTRPGLSPAGSADRFRDATLPPSVSFAAPGVVVHGSLYTHE
ncbi:hypothetical protein [Halosimplex sp. TS25]|uniref:hypothetical protein n=1 Tax=Halosimplex rarum TaxID=3396619 RepID=UPI0039EA427A